MPLCYVHIFASFHPMSKMREMENQIKPNKILCNINILYLRFNIKIYLCWNHIALKSFFKISSTLIVNYYTKEMPPKILFKKKELLMISNDAFS